MSTHYEEDAENVPEQPSFTNMNPPNDLDTTSLALQVMPPDNDTITSMLDNMLKYINPDGIPHSSRPSISLYSSCRISYI